MYMRRTGTRNSAPLLIVADLLNRSGFTAEFLLQKICSGRLSLLLFEVFSSLPLIRLKAWATENKALVQDSLWREVHRSKLNRNCYIAHRSSPDTLSLSSFLNFFCISL